MDDLEMPETINMDDLEIPETVHMDDLRRSKHRVAPVYHSTRR